MAKFLIGTKEGKTYAVEKDIEIAMGKRIGDTISGEQLQLDGYELQVMGGSDKQGFPMRKDVAGSGRVKPVLSKGVGMKSKGSRKRKTVRGNTISDEITQVSLKVIKEGPKKLEDTFGKEAQSEQQATTS